jgi:RHS repeat-associated protein
VQNRTSSDNSRRAAFLISAVLALFSLAHLAFAQGAPNDYQIGFPQHADFSGSDFENVQLNNGNLHIEIPLWSMNGRGLPVGFKYAYDSKGWGFNEHCGRLSGTCTDTVSPTPGSHGIGPCCANGNHLVLAPIGPQSYQINEAIGSYTCSGGVKVLTYSYNMSAPDGTRHHFGPDPIEAGSEVGYCFPTQTTLYADDGSGWVLQLDPSNAAILKAVGKDGTVVAGSTVEDANGNEVITTGTDTLGRQFNLDGSYYDSNGVLRAIAVVRQNVAIQTALCGESGADFCNEYSSTWSVPQTLTLPNGLIYTFGYDQGSPTHPYYGQPLSVTLPTGGQITWGWSGVTVSGPTLVSRHLSGDPAPWLYSGFGYLGGKVTDPAGNDMAFTCAEYIPPYSLLGGAPVCYINSKKSYQGSSTSGTLVKTAQTDYWTTNEPAILPIHETTTWNQQNVVNRTETDYDSYAPWSFNNVTYYVTASNPVEKREYDNGTGTWGSLIRTTDYGYLHLSNPTYLGLNIVDKETSKKVYAGSSGSGTLTAQTLTTYDGVVIPASGDTHANPAPNHDYTNFPASHNYRGNLTQVSKGLKSGSTWTWLNTNNTYNDLGEVLTSKDPVGNQTSYDYTDSWATINNPQCVTSAHSYGFPTTITDPLNHQTKHTYYSCTSLTGSTQDANDIAASRPGTTFSYDLMSRATAVHYPDGGQTTFSYNDAVPYTKTSTQLIRTSPTTLNKLSAVVHDGLGRVQQTQLTDPDCSSGPVKVDYTYSYDPSPPTGIPAGRFTTVSNPYCTTSDSTYGITKTRYDALDRPVLVIPPDGSDTANNVSTTYSGTTTGLTTTVTDQAGAARKSQTDALGRMTYVWEDPATSNYETDYTYNVLDDLVGVTQKGGSTSTNWRTRSFQYDSLGRLTQAVNPESGTINYSYDTASNLFQKAAPQANTPGTTYTTFCYDADNRLASKTYSAQICPVASPAVSFLYDQSSYNGLTITNGIGRRTGMSDGSGTTAWSFDPMGRTAAEQRTLNTNVTKSFTFYYYADGEMKQTVWPTSHQITYTPSAAGRSVSALGTTFNFVSSATYAPQGAIASALVGNATGFNGVTVANTYNKRLQPSAITASLPSNALVQSLTYNFNLSTADNGNVFKITNGKDATRNQTFTYDRLNRITTATTQGTTGAYCWGQKFGYMSNGNFVLGPDPWGNVTQIQNTQSQCNSPTLNQGIGTNNQFISPMVYDSAGNLINDGAHPFTYDTENRLATAGGVTYTYDGDGKRVKKSNGTLYWTGPGWDPLLETDLSGNATEEYVFFNGERVARVDMPANTVEYYFSDHLNSTDIVTNATGGIVRESDYVPYGGEVVISGTDPNRYKFTGKERDPESGLDDFDARFYSSPFGRFMTPDWEAKPTDVPYANFGNPQSLNLYSYVQNNPTTTGDPDGHDGWDILAGAFNSFGSDFFGGAGRKESSSEGYNKGQVLGDLAAVYVGEQEAEAGAGGEVLSLLGDGAGVGELGHVLSGAAIVQGATAIATGGIHLLKETGTIYRVPGQSTPSGRPYIGRHNQPDPAKTRKSPDGRDRTKAKVVDKYNAKNTQQGRVKEQQHIDRRGLKNLDNKRNEIRKTKKKKSS